MWHCAVAGIVTLLLSLFAVPRVAHTQAPGQVHRIGVFNMGPAPSAAEWQQSAFVQELRQLGYVEGQTIVIEQRYANGQREHLPSLVDELVRLQLDLIVVTGHAAAQAVTHATSAIPIVAMGAGDLVGTGLVASLAHPGGNLTGISGLAVDISGKRLELLKEAIPTLARVAVLWNTRDAAMTRSFTQIEEAARALGLTVLPLGVQEVHDFDQAFAAITEARPDALFMIADAFTIQHRARILDFAATRLPTMFNLRELVDAGGLMSYGPSSMHVQRRAASYVDRILKGAKPSDLPVEQTMQFELVINLKTAQALGLTIAPIVMFQADEVLR
jgi:putative tryptophan/tyrosine transport system substrate-binding protein